MTDYDTYAVLGAVYDNQDAAEMDYEAVKSLYYDWKLIDNFDAAIVAKRDDGKVKIVKKHEQPTRKGGWHGAGWGLAAGAAVALFPAAAIGGGLLAATTGGGAAIGAIAGHVSKGMNRGDLKDLGENLDAGTVRSDRRRRRRRVGKGQAGDRQCQRHHREAARRTRRGARRRRRRRLLRRLTQDTIPPPPTVRGETSRWSHLSRRDRSGCGPPRSGTVWASSTGTSRYGLSAYPSALHALARVFDPEAHF